MNIRYLGFEQQKNARSYQFDLVEKGQPSRKFVVIADLALFLRHRVAIQEGPTLSASKLVADLERDGSESHELTDEDFRLHTAARLAAEAARAEKRGPRRSSAAAASAQAPPSFKPPLY